jgi:hypothetical protein
MSSHQQVPLSAEERAARREAKKTEKNFKKVTREVTRMRNALCDERADVRRAAALVSLGPVIILVS